MYIHENAKRGLVAEVDGILYQFTDTGCLFLLFVIDRDYDEVWYGPPCLSCSDSSGSDIKESL